jgi:hypothetical protein
MMVLPLTTVTLHLGRAVSVDRRHASTSKPPRDQSARVITIEPSFASVPGEPKMHRYRLWFAGNRRTVFLARTVCQS